MNRLGAIAVITNTFDRAAALARVQTGAARLLGAVLSGRPEQWPDPPPAIAALPEAMGQAEFTAAFEAGAALDPRVVAELAHQTVRRGSRA